MRLAAACFFAIIAAAPAYAQQGDCAKAAAPADRVICADPKAAAADKSMAMAYEALRARLTEEQRGALLASQRAWLARRARACDAKAADFAPCITRQTQERAEALAVPKGQRPLFLGGARGLDGRLLEFEQADTRAKRGFNAAMAQARTHALKEARINAAEPRFEYQADATISYVSPSLVSGRVAWYEYSGGAHPNHGGYGVNIDARGRPLRLDDLFDAKGLSAIEALCLAQLATQKKERLEGAFSQEDAKALPGLLAEPLRDVKNWSFSPAGAALDFAPYVVGAYAEGDYSCAIPLRELRAAARPGAPLPQ
ncbi:MAG: DUF1311 domain-containing protein [Hyphomicrobiales bacterium]|nr:DUF1311 domain-containing protein [Hyphomicrobiales bacterium]